MYSKKLKTHGLANWIGGAAYNFRQTTAGEGYTEDVKKLLKEAQMQPKELYTGKQVHGKHVAYCDGENGEPFVIGRQFTETDGLLTDKPGIALLVKFADCTPIVLFDPKTKVQAIVHSGWRGTAAKISHEALRKMEKEHGVQKEDIIAYVGPSIGQTQYEVGPEVYQEFTAQADRGLYFKVKGEKYLLDMGQANYQLLIDAGIHPKNIEVESAKTFGNDKLHSAREEGEKYGLNAMVTMII